jgi:hypothetical protein
MKFRSLAYLYQLFELFLASHNKSRKRSAGNSVEPLVNTEKAIPQMGDT